MLSVFLAYFDQLRAVAGLLLTCFVFCHHAAPRRAQFAQRAALWCVLLFSMGFAYVPLEPMIRRLPTVAYGAATAGYWLVVIALVVMAVFQCYELSLSNAAFRALLGFTLEGVITTFLRYLVVMIWQPSLPERYPVSYILLCLFAYLVICCAAYLLLAKRLQQGGGAIKESAGSVYTYLVTILIFQLIMFATNGICEWLVPALMDNPALYWGFDLIRYFCVGIRLMVCVVFFVSYCFVYVTTFLQNERELVSQLLREKNAQYEFNRENIEFIQRKCHDLKRQLRALEMAGEGERKTVLEETRQAAEFYDATIHTGHEVLDTLLTEKNLLCTNRGIRLSCAVSLKNIGKIGTVDLYTMLSNALDNAIEGVERLNEPEKKTIRFYMVEREGVLHIEVENYYEGTIILKHGLPATSKEDKNDHGIGVRSIRALAQRYGGNIEIDIEDQVFLLQIVIPLSN